ncbi:MAG: mechanosensitive ion channel family protein [Rhodospirillaceae bacterium]|jgi:MscS family membrane protein|nr:mechanosensitive ion channel family protein [Rhodospirillaceae bacterium]
MQGFAEFWTLVVEVWHNGLLGVDVGKILSALGVFALFVLLRGLLTRVFLRWIRVLVRRTATKLDDAIVDALEPPIRLVPVVVGAFFAIRLLEFEGIYDQIWMNFIRSLIAFTFFWGVFRAIEPLSGILTRLERLFTLELVEWLVKAMRVAVVLVGAATILQIWGIQVGPIIAGAGLFGVAVALGAQDLFKNLIAGILILGEKRFRKGDWIFVHDTVEGTVESIGFRSTMVRRFDKALVMVPNTKLSDTAVTNFSQMSHRRIYWKIGVEYSTTVDQLRQIRDGIEAYIVDGDEFAAPSEVSTFVRIDRFSDSSIDIMVYCFTRTTEWGKWLEIKERLAFKVKEIVETAGTGFAFPSRSVYLEQASSEQPEVFVPPTTNTNEESVSGRQEKL